MTTKPIFTDRFVLTKLTFLDSEKYYRLSNNDNVMKYVTGYGLTREESDKMLRDIIADHDGKDFFGRYLVEDRVSGETIGIGRLDGNGNEVEIGYRIAEEHWGRGAATEIATSLIRFAVKKLGAERVVAYVNVENHASVRVLEKSGMQLEERIEEIDEIKYLFTYIPEYKPLMEKALYLILGIFVIVLILW